MLIAQTKPAPAGTVRVAGTRVSFMPPPGFMPSEQFTGYGLESEGAAVMIVEMPVRLAEVLPALSDPAALSKRSMILLGKEAVSVAGLSGWLFHYRQTAGGSELLKWMLVVGDAKELVMVTASFPTESERKFSAALRRSVLSVRWHRGESVAADEGLNFRVTVAGGTLKLARRMSNTLLYTPGGVFPNKSVDDPLFVVGPSTARTEIVDLKAFSVARVSQINEVGDIGVVEPGEITVDNLKGYEIETTGRDRKSGRPLAVYQVLLFDGDVYYLMQGLAGAQHASPHLETFKQMARSFRRVTLRDK